MFVPRPPSSPTLGAVTSSSRSWIWMPPPLKIPRGEEEDGGGDGENDGNEEEEEEEKEEEEVYK